MRFTHLLLENWRNFKAVDVPLQRRAFIVGPNASGKSNLLDAFRFLRDLAEPEGTFQAAVQDRGGVSQVRCLHARGRPSWVAVDVEMEIGGTGWRYRVEFGQDPQRQPRVRGEKVWKDGQQILSRPDADDEADPERLTQTHLEQINANQSFRDIADFLAQIRYLHVVPQFVREPDRFQGRRRDPYGGDFLEQLATTPKKTLESRLVKINRALQVAVPQLKKLELERDTLGVPHLKGLYEHWRPNAGWQTEEHFSDGTLRLLGLLWAFLDGTAPLLLEEPELSLHSAVVRHIPSMMARAGKSSSRKAGESPRQVLISTHSPEMLSDPGIAAEEILLLEPSQEATQVRLASEDHTVETLLREGLTAAEVVLSATAPKSASQLALFGP